MKPFETETREIEGVTYKIQWYVDECPDHSLLGEYTAKDDDYIIDRRDGTLRGAYLPEPDYESLEFLDTSGKIDDDVYEAAWDVWDESDREILARWLHTMKRNEYEFFKPAQYLSRDPKNREHVSAEDIEKAYQRAKKSIEEFSVNETRRTKQEILDIVYACQDYERIEALSRGDWCMTICQVEILVDGKVVISDSLGGIESDISHEYKGEIILNLIAECNHRLPKELAAMEKLLRQAQKITPSEPKTAHILIESYAGVLGDASVYLCEADAKAAYYQWWADHDCDDDEEIETAIEHSDDDILEWVKGKLIE